MIRLSVLHLAFGLLPCLSLVGCSSSQIETSRETWADQISLADISPVLITQGTELTISGSGFVGSEVGNSQLILSLRGEGNSSTPPVVINQLLSRTSRTEMSTRISPSNFDRICPFDSMYLEGEMNIETVSSSTGKVYNTKPSDVRLRCDRMLTPALTQVPFQAINLNDSLVVSATGILYGGDEGVTTAVVNGCIKPQGAGGPCDSELPRLLDHPVEIFITDRRERSNPGIIIGADLTGLKPGFFDGTVRLQNRFPSGQTTESETLPLSIQVLDSSLASVNVNGTSLGGYLDFTGQGFVGRNPQELTTIIIDGRFENIDGTIQDIRTEVVTEYASPSLVRYVLNEEDTLGQSLKLRKNQGVLVAQFTPIISFQSQERQLPSLQSAFEVKPILQVVHANFLPGFDDALEDFGLLNASSLIRNLIVERTAEIFAGIGLEIRLEAPDDYAIYSQVDITGFDPNGIGLMGYDNTPGKDVGNERLHDRIGGVHAITQEDGYPGYGGIFLESFFGFSQRPPSGIQSHPGASPLFDQIFSITRPDSGTPASTGEVSQFVKAPPNQTCLSAATTRWMQVNCAIQVLANLVGSTLAHEIAHSLGLADPEGALFHNPQPGPNHLMDAGGERSFEERAVLVDNAGEFFCRENYEYLRSILKTNLPDPLPSRTPCY